MRILFALISVCMLVLPISSWAKTIVILGDSISAAYGMSSQQGWVSLLQKRLDQQYPKQHKVVNASISGETTSGALARLPKVLSTHRPDILVIELGGNDALRGQPPRQIEQNLARMVQQAQKNKTKVILFGMKIPPNYGTAYSTAFEKTFQSVAKEYQLSFMPFFLAGVAEHPHLMQSDRIHPNAKAQARLLNNAWPFIQKSLK